MRSKASLGQGTKDRVPIERKTVAATSEDRFSTLVMKVERDSEDEEAEEDDQLEREVVARKVNEDWTTDAVKTVLVPVRDPVTQQIRNMLVPVEVRDKTGLNMIKSVLVPFQSSDGSVSYEIRKVTVPITIESKLLENADDVKETGKESKEADPKEEKQETRAVEEVNVKVEQFLDEEAKSDSPGNESEDNFEVMDQTLRNSCPLCQKCFKDEHEMQKHVRRSHRKRYSCDKCQKRCMSEQALEKHQKTHVGASFLQCSVCNLRYKTNVGLKNHYVREHSSLDPKFTCDYCGRCFKLKHDLSIHIDRTHMNPEYICRFCGRAVKNILHHEATHEEEVNKGTSRYRCDHCPKDFKLLNRLANHLLKKHNDRSQPSMLRTLCEKNFQSKKDFYRHVLAEERMNRYKCDTCGKTYANEQNLRSHAAVHSHTFVCHLCSKNFANNYSLKLHLRMHTGERPYQCKVCLKTFSRTNALRVHQFTHTGERPYVCDLCGQSFTQRSSMMGHRRKHPGNHPPPPPLSLSKLELNEHLTL
nr:PREDICTED: zinc finger protein 2 homolog [Megachile rotundata]